MKTYNELTERERQLARRKTTEQLLEAILSGALRFSDKDNGDDLQARIDAACAEAERMQTPWFAHEYIMETCGQEIRGMAECDAEDALYSQTGERVIHGIVD